MARKTGLLEPSKGGREGGRALKEANNTPGKCTAKGQVTPLNGTLKAITEKRLVTHPPGLA